MSEIRGEVVCIATFVAEEGKENELHNALYVLIEPTRKEGGCLRYELHQNLEDFNEFTVVEKFKDMDAFYFHGNQPYLENFKSIVPVLAASIDVNVYKELTIL